MGVKIIVIVQQDRKKRSKYRNTRLQTVCVGMVQLGLIVVQCLGLILWFFFWYCAFTCSESGSETAFIETLFAVTKKSKTAKTQWYSKDNPYWWINGHRPSFKHQSASSVTACSVKYISCPVQCQLCQWAVPQFCFRGISLWSLEAGGVLWKCSDWQCCADGSRHLQLHHKLSPGVESEIKGNSLREATKATNSSPQRGFISVCSEKAELESQSKQLESLKCHLSHSQSNE